MRNRAALIAPALAAAAGLSLLATACGGSAGTGVVQIGSTQTTTTGSNSSASRSDRQAMVAFSACMRKHGVPTFPDPKAVSGGYSLSFGSENGIDPNSPQFKNAQQACKKLLPNGGTQDSQEQAKQLQTALNYAACIRSHGVPNFPDPKLHAGGGIDMEAPNSPQFKTAQKACQHLLPGGGD
jgi:hypothetical protein